MRKEGREGWNETEHPALTLELTLSRYVESRPLLALQIPSFSSAEKSVMDGDCECREMCPHGLGRMGVLVLARRLYDLKLVTSPT